MSAKKLTPDVLDRIVQMREAGATITEMAPIFGMTPTLVHRGLRMRGFLGRMPAAEKPPNNLIGARFGRLEVVAGPANELSDARPHRHIRWYWLVRCFCGNEFWTQQHSLVTVGIESCGCIKNERLRAAARLRAGPNNPGWKGGKWAARHACFVHYSGGKDPPECVGCGETDENALTLDHVRNDGHLERRKEGFRGSVYTRLRLEGFPGYPDSLVTLCASCQLRKVRNQGVLVPSGIKQ